VARFRDALPGPPTSWVPLGDPPSHIPSASPNELAHIPGEGRGVLSLNLVVESEVEWRRRGEMVIG